MYNDYNGLSSGAAYVFTRSGTVWIEEQKLIPLGYVYLAGFGQSVSIDGDYTVIGAPYDQTNGYYIGSAYIFKRSGTTWTRQAKLIASDGEEMEEFGNSVSIDGESVIVGSIDKNLDYTGAAYYFKRSGTTWTEKAKLLPSDGEPYHYFGCSVSIDGDYTIIGAFDDDDNGEEAGAAYIFVTSSDNLPPETPELDGLIEGTVGEEYDYTFVSTDPENQDVWYYIEWGDGETEEWIGPYSSGQEITVSHTWDEEDTYTIRAKAKDIFDAESDWGTLQVTMPISHQDYSFPLLQRLLERFPNMFPILRFLFTK